MARSIKKTSLTSKVPFKVIVCFVTRPASTESTAVSPTRSPNRIRTGRYVLEINIFSYFLRFYLLFSSFSSFFLLLFFFSSFFLLFFLFFFLFFSYFFLIFFLFFSYFFLFYYFMKVWMCKNGDDCKYAASCVYAHSDKELRTGTINRQLLDFYERQGTK